MQHKGEKKNYFGVNRNDKMSRIIKISKENNFSKTDRKVNHKMSIDVILVSLLHFYF